MDSDFPVLTIDFQNGLKPCFSNCCVATTACTLTLVEIANSNLSAILCQFITSLRLSLVLALLEEGKA